MPTTKKIFTVDNLAEKIKQARGLILSDYQGLSMSQISQLRREISKSGGEFEVVKNTLLKLAATAGKLENLAIDKLTGPTAALWIYEENPAPLKTLDKFIRQNSLPKIKLGFWNKELLDEDKIKMLAGLPGPEDLRAKLATTLQSPIFRLSLALGWNIKKLLSILKSEAQNPKS